MDPVAIANLALGWLGASPIVAFTDSSKNASLIAGAFDGLRDAVLEDRDWTFAIQRMQLQADPVAPAFGYTTRFALPSTALRVTYCEIAQASGSLSSYGVLAGQTTDSSNLTWEKEGRYILAGSTGSAQAGVPIPAVNVKAVMQIIDATWWSPGFCQALAARLAADLCVPITQKRDLFADMWKLYEQKLRDAAANDGRQGRAEVRRSSTIAKRRR